MPVKKVVWAEKAACDMKKRRNFPYQYFLPFKSYY